MALSAKLKDVLQRHGQDLKVENLVPMIADAYLQGGK